MRTLAAIFALALAGCETTSPEPETVVQLKAPVTVQPDHPIPAKCRAAGFPAWGPFRSGPEGPLLREFAADVQREKRRRFIGLSRVQNCECLIIRQWGSAEDKDRMPGYCRNIRGEA